MGKRIRPLALAMLLSLVLAACGGQTASTPSGSAGASSGSGTGTSASPSASSTTSASQSTAASASASPSTSASASSSPSTRASTSPSASASASGGAGAGATETETASASGGAGATETETAETTETAGTGETDAAGGGSATLPVVDPSEFAGEEIVAAGSSTVFPLTEAIAERWGNEGGQPPTIDSVGTGGGFERFCVNAASDIANASRPIDEEEAAACEQNGRPAVEFRVGTDALVVATSAENDFLEELTTEQLAQVFSTATNWSDIDPSFPNEPIERFTPGTDSGTFDYFVEEIFDEDPAPLLGAQNLQQSEDDNVLVQGVEGSPNAIGFFGFSYFQENEDRLKAIAIDGVEPNAETAESNEYPLSRPLFIYSAESVMEEKPQVAAFINFYLTNVNEEIEAVGYFPASEDALNEARQNFLTATGQ